MITLRPMRAAMEDYQYMQAWFAEPELQQWVWCDEKGEPPVSLERIAEKYGTRAQNPTDVFPCFILHAGEPIGFIQYCLHTEEAIAWTCGSASPASAAGVMAQKPCARWSG